MFEGFDVNVFVTLEPGYKYEGGQERCERCVSELEKYEGGQERCERCVSELENTKTNELLGSRL